MSLSLCKITKHENQMINDTGVVTKEDIVEILQEYNLSHCYGVNFTDI